MNDHLKSHWQPINLPAWLGDPDAIAPCVCGRSLRTGELPVFATGELGMKRWFHMICWNMLHDEEWDDDEDDEDED